MRTAAFLCVISLAWASSLAAETEPKETLVTVVGQVVDQTENAVAGATVTVRGYNQSAETTTDDEGKFRCQFEERALRLARILVNDAQADRLGIFEVAYHEPPTPDKPITITVEPAEHLPVEVTDVDGQPAEGVKVGGMWQWYPLFHATTAADGKATLRYPKNSPPDHLYALQEGVGIDYRTINSQRDGAYRADWFANPPIKLQLAETKTIRFQVVDSDEKPVAGVRMQPWMLAKPGEPDPFNFNLMPDTFFPTRDADGLAEIQGFPAWPQHGFTFFIYSQNKSRGRYDILQNEPIQDPIKLVVDEDVTVRGQVVTADGKPVSGVEVAAAGENHRFDREHNESTTDDSGHFEMELRPNLLYAFTVRDKTWATPVVDGIVVRPKQPIDDLKLTAQEPTRIFGQIVIGEEAKPAAGQRLSLQQHARGSDQVLNTNLYHPVHQEKHVARPTIHRSATADAEGRYEFFVGPGNYGLFGSSQLDSESFSVTDQQELEFNFKLDLPEESELAGTVVTGNPPMPVPNVAVELKYRASRAPFNTRVRTDEKGRFTLQRKPHGIDLYVQSEDGALAGMKSIAADDDSVTIELSPTATLTGTLINSITKKPLAGVRVSRYRPVYRDGSSLFTPAWSDSTTTDQQGKFRLAELVVQQKYFLSCRDEEATYRGLPNYIPVEPGTLDLGEVELTPQQRSR